MAINAINNDSDIKRNIKTSLAVGAISAGIHGAFLSKEAKSAIKNTIIGEDAFLKNTEKSVLKASKEFGQEIDVKQTLEYAKDNYPKIKQFAGAVVKNIGKSFAAVTAGVFAGSIIADKIFKEEHKSL